MTRSETEDKDRGAGEDGPAYDIHTVRSYKHLLRVEFPKIFVFPPEDWDAITEEVFRLCVDRDRPTSKQRLMPRLFDWADEKKLAPEVLSGVLFQIFWSDCFVKYRSEDEKLDDINIDEAQLQSEIETVDDLKGHIQVRVVELLHERLQKRAGGLPVPTVLAELFYSSTHKRYVDDMNQILIEHLIE